MMESCYGQLQVTANQEPAVSACSCYQKAGEVRYPRQLWKPSAVSCDAVAQMFTGLQSKHILPACATRQQQAAYQKSTKHKAPLAIAAVAFGT